MTGSAPVGLHKLKDSRSVSAIPHGATEDHLEKHQRAGSIEQGGETTASVGDESVLKAPSRRRPLYACGLLVGVIIIGWGLNYVLVGQPVASKLGADPRNSVYSLSAHFRYYIDPTTLVLDLRDVGDPAPVDLFRAVFQSAEALHATGRRFDRVILARLRTPVFTMTGDAFSTLGEEFSEGQNPVYLIRTLPEKLYRPSGEAAFGQWQGGLIGVLGKQMEDASEAARQWINGD